MIRILRDFIFYGFTLNTFSSQLLTHGINFTTYFSLLLLVASFFLHFHCAYFVFSLRFHFPFSMLLFHCWTFFFCVHYKLYSVSFLFLLLLFPRFHFFIFFLPLLLFCSSVAWWRQMGSKAPPWDNSFASLVCSKSNLG